MEKQLQVIENLLNIQEIVGKNSFNKQEIIDIVKQADSILSDINNEISKKDFATKEQRDTFNDIRINHIKQTYMDIANKITDIKKLDKYPNYVFYMVDNIVFMKHDLISDIVYIRYWEFWELFEKRFNLNYNQISLLLKSFLQVNLDCHVNSTECESIVYLERYFK